jgi:hypothetical protein
MTNVETLQEAIEAGLKIFALHAGSGEVVKCWNLEDLSEIEWQDGTLEKVSINDLIDFRWE